MKPGTVAQPEGDLRSVEGWKPHDFITVCSVLGGGRTVMASGIFMCAVAICSGMHRNTARCMAGLVSRGLNNATENADFDRQSRDSLHTLPGENRSIVHILTTPGLTSEMWSLFVSAVQVSKRNVL